MSQDKKVAAGRRLGQLFNWSVPGLLVTVFLVFSCSRNSNPSDPSVIVTGRGVSDKVENGTAFDRAVVDVGNAKKVVLPDTAVVRRGGEAGKVQLYMAKELGFVGHPPEPMNPTTARRNMGGAVRMEGDVLVVGTYGEWDSHIEGGASMRVVAVVPEGVQIEQRNGLTGPKSSAQEWNSPYLSNPNDAQGGYWYAPASPAEGWKAVPAVPDAERTASRP